MSQATADFPVVLYARVSRVRDERHKSVTDQLRELRAWAAREGWPVHAEHRDDDISASRFGKGKQRDGWQATLDDLLSGKVRGLLAWESSRTTRDKKVFAALEETCRQHRVLYGFSGQLYDLSTSDGEFQVGLRNLLDVQESAKISERVRRAANSRAADGRPHGPLQYGYQRIIHPRTGAVLGREGPTRTRGPTFSYPSPPAPVPRGGRVVARSVLVPRHSLRRVGVGRVRLRLSCAWPPHGER